MCYRFFLVILLIHLIVGIASGESPLSKENEIVPGEGVADVQLGRPAPIKPAELKAWLQGLSKKGIQVEISATPPQVTKIHILSPNYPVIDNRIRVGKSHIEDIIRFYGAVQKKFFKDQIVLSYPGLGVEFTIDPRSLVIKKISVFNKKPVLFKIDSKAIDRFQKILKQSK
jgi:hypothetical protein